MKPQHIAALFAGAVAGVGAMYLLDPDQGERRRKMLAAKAGGYWDDLSDAAGDRWHNVSGHVRDLGQHAMSAAQHLANDAADRVHGHINDVSSQVQSHAQSAHNDATHYAQSWIEQGRRWLEGYRNQAAGYRDQAADYRDQAMKNVPHSSAELQDTVRKYGQAAWQRAQSIGSRAHDRAMDAVNRGRRAIAPPPPPPIVPVAVTALGFLAMGAGAMYVMDPAKGRARRAWFGDKVRSAVRRSGTTAYKKGRHLANRAYGMASEARTAGEDLVGRAQQALSKIMADPRVVKVMADANGRITLAGHVVAEQMERIVQAVESLPGVTEVINKLESIVHTNKAENSAESADQVQH